MFIGLFYFISGQVHLQYKKCLRVIARNPSLHRQPCKYKSWWKAPQPSRLVIKYGFVGIYWEFKENMFWKNKMTVFYKIQLFSCFGAPSSNVIKTKRLSEWGLVRVNCTFTFLCTLKISKVSCKWPNSFFKYFLCVSQRCFSCLKFAEEKKWKSSCC